MQLDQGALGNMMMVIWLATNFLSHALSLRLLSFHLAFSDLLTNCPAADKWRARFTSCVGHTNVSSYVAWKQI